MYVTLTRDLTVTVTPDVLLAHFAKSDIVGEILSKDKQTRMELAV